MGEVKIGVVGYSAQKFDEEKAKEYIRNAFDRIDKTYPRMKKVIVSGLTYMGIPGLAYEETRRRGWKTVGVAPEEANSPRYRKFPVDEEIIVGKKWGDESSAFLTMLDVLVKIGGGKQSKKEAEEFQKTGKPLFEYQLEPEQ